MNLYKFYSKPTELMYHESDKSDKIPAVAWQKYQPTGDLIYHSKTFAKSAEYAYKYADIYDMEFPEGEEAIATSHKYSYEYAKWVLRGRFEKGEAAIGTEPYYSYYYARDILLKDYPAKNFPEGEKVMKTDTTVWKMYNKRLKEAKLPYDEAVIK